jgi:hypothetical protein
MVSLGKQSSAAYIHLGFMSARPVLARLAEIALDGFRIKVHASCVFFLHAPAVGSGCGGRRGSIGELVERVRYCSRIVCLLISRFRSLGLGAAAVLSTSIRHPSNGMPKHQ